MNEVYIPMLKRRHGWDDERLRRGEESPTKVKQYHAQRAELLSMVESLQAKVEELEGLCAITGVIEREKKYIALQAKVEGLEEKIDDLINARNLAWDKGYSQGRDDAHQTIAALQIKVEKLTEALKDIYKATTDLQVMSIVMANLPQPKTIPAALSQENEL